MNGNESGMNIKKSATTPPGGWKPPLRSGGILAAEPCIAPLSPSASRKKMSAPLHAAGLSQRDNRYPIARNTYFGHTRGSLAVLTRAINWVGFCAAALLISVGCPAAE